MNFEKLFATQRVLREKINYNEPDRFEKLILALLVEVGECANEWRGFKFWSKNQSPNQQQWAVGKRQAYLRNPLLEEYVDGLHFVLELGIEIADEIGFETYEYFKGIESQKGIQIAGTKTITDQFILVSNYSAQLNYDDFYCELFAAYINLGEMLGFTPEEIEAAYFEKNKVNHERQENGY